MRSRCARSGARPFLHLAGCASPGISWSVGSGSTRRCTRWSRSPGRWERERSCWWCSLLERSGRRFAGCSGRSPHSARSPESSRRGPTSRPPRPPLPPRAALPPARAGAPDVVLVVLDTVRADRMASYGHTRDTSPTFDSLAREGAWFADATSPATWSLPAHASLFTGATRPATARPVAVRPRRPLPDARGGARGARIRDVLLHRERVDQRRPRPHARVRRAEPVVEEEPRGLVRGPRCSTSSASRTGTRAARSSPTTSRPGGARGPRTLARPSSS